MKFSLCSIVPTIYLLLLLFLSCIKTSIAESIYQWSDPWGHIKYSKTQVPGSMLSDLTELPETQKITQQQKQDAMLDKIQQIEKSETLILQQNNVDKIIRLQIKENETHCRKLRNILTDVRLRRSRFYLRDNYHYPGHPYYLRRNDSDKALEKDLYWQIRDYCR